MMLKDMAVDQELSAKIQSELDMERESRDSDKVPARISEYLESSSFEVAPHLLRSHNPRRMKWQPAN